MLKISVDQEGNDGRLRVLSKSVKGFGVPMKRLMKIFHLEMNR